VPWLSLLAVGCGPRVLVDDEDPTQEDGSTGEAAETGTVPSPTRGDTSPTVPGTTTTTSGTDEGADVDDGADDDDGCTLDDECIEDADCVPGQTCLPNCVCFGAPGTTGDPEPDCDEANSCQSCVQCAVDPGGECEMVLSACVSKPECLDLLECLGACMDRACEDECLATHPGAEPEFSEFVLCMTETCPNACPD
jgi:hypothetical protein